MIEYQKRSALLIHRCKLEKSTSDHVSLEKKLLPQLAALEAKEKFNVGKLEIEAKKAEESEKKVGGMQVHMTKMQEQLIRWQIEVATRQSEASMNEVRLFFK